MGKDSSDKIIEQVKELAHSICESEGLELVHAEFSAMGKTRLLRIYIDKEGGVGLDDCASISRELSDILDVKIEIPGKYSLEVSSPGLNRPLVKPSDYSRFKGEKVFIKISEPLTPEFKRNNFKGLIKHSNDESVIIELENGEKEIPFEKIKSARLNPDI